jgi:hypothetical protein
MTCGLTLDAASSITLQTIRVSSEYGHFDMNIKIPHIGPKKCLEQSVTTGPHVKMGEILAKGLMVIHENRVVVFLSVSWDLT